jgi:hypothetical protein
VGYAENSALPLGTYANFRGVVVDATSVLVAYTRTGDANLDGLVDDNDVTVVGATYSPTTAQAHWALGDFDYNGFVADDDVTLLGVFYQPVAPAPPQVSGGMVSGEGLKYEGQSTKYEGPGTAGRLVVAGSPDRATSATEGLRTETIVERFRQREVRSASAAARRGELDDALLDLLAMSIAGAEDGNTSIGDARLAIHRNWPADHQVFEFIR